VVRLGSQSERSVVRMGSFGLLRLCSGALLRSTRVLRERCGLMGYRAVGAALCSALDSADVTAPRPAIKPLAKHAVSK
jgi:hypothetical protein